MTWLLCLAGIIVTTAHKVGLYNNEEIYRICLTGGPCAGKTTALSMLQEKLQPSYKVFLAPELATLTAMGGYDIRPTADIQKQVNFSVIDGLQLESVSEPSARS